MNALSNVADMMRTAEETPKDEPADRRDRSHSVDALSMTNHKASGEGRYETVDRLSRQGASAAQSQCVPMAIRRS